MLINLSKSITQEFSDISHSKSLFILVLHHLKFILNPINLLCLRLYYRCVMWNLGLILSFLPEYLPPMGANLRLRQPSSLEFLLLKFSLLLFLLIFFTILIFFITKLVENIVVKQKFVRKVAVATFKHLDAMIFKSYKEHLGPLEIEHHKALDQVSY